jgi:hypothetical protein
MCCGENRSILKETGIASQAALNLMYYGLGAVNVRGPVTGQLYQFSRVYPVQSVDVRDAVCILKTRLFRQAR